jgi:hypothetical protein
MAHETQGAHDPVTDNRDLTPDDAQLVLSEAGSEVAGAPGFVSPQDFYREAMKREDVRRIMAALAK